MQRVLIISNDVIGRKMAGPGIRYFHIARILSRYATVTLAVPDLDAPDESVLAMLPGVSLAHFRQGEWGTIEGVTVSAEIIIFPSGFAWQFPQLADLPASLVVDGYDPLMMEWLEVSDLTSEAAQQKWPGLFTELHAQFAIGDFYICASERQRDWWLGLLEASGRINPWTYEQDRSLRQLIDVVAYGVPEIAEMERQPVIKGVWDGIRADDIVLLWGGGLWKWLDPLTAIRAVAQLAEAMPTLRLIFPGTSHPNPGQANMPTHNEAAKELAQALGVFGRNVYFGDWVPYDQWSALLLECDVALSLHYETVETRLAFRSRILEYIAAGLPMVATEGDATSELVRQYGLGSVVAYEDVDGVAEAIREAVENSAEVSPGFAAAQAELSWENALRPLIAFCMEPKRAADRPKTHAIGAPRFETYGKLPQQQITELKAVVEGYKNGRVMKAMNRLNGLTKRFSK